MEMVAADQQTPIFSQRFHRAGLDRPDQVALDLQRQVNTGPIALACSQPDEKDPQPSWTACHLLHQPTEIFPYQSSVCQWPFPVRETPNNVGNPHWCSYSWTMKPEISLCRLLHLGQRCIFPLPFSGQGPTRPQLSVHLCCCFLLILSSHPAREQDVVLTGNAAWHPKAVYYYSTYCCLYINKNILKKKNYYQYLSVYVTMGPISCLLV